MNKMQRKQNQAMKEQLDLAFSELLETGKQLWQNIKNRSHFARNSFWPKTSM